MDAAYLRTIIDYNPETGEFHWKKRPDVGSAWNARMAGKASGCIHKDGYVVIGINGSIYQAHRLAWLWVTGGWPKEQIDHIDSNRSNNIFGNLREATQEQNNRNIRRAKNNTSGFKGVCFDKDTGKWQAQIRIGGGRRIYLGQFASPEEAHAAYKGAAVEAHGNFARFA